MAQLVYDVTVRFCDKYIDRRSRTHDQMASGASGVQNIAEGACQRHVQEDGAETANAQGAGRAAP